MKRPTANVSGDNPGIQPLWPARSVTRRSFTSALLPSRIFPDWFLQYGYLGNAPLLAITDVFHLAGEQGHYIPANTLSL